MDKTLVCGTKNTGSIPVESTLWRSVPNGKAPVSKTGERKLLQVQILSPPPDALIVEWIQ